MLILLESRLRQRLIWRSLSSELERVANWGRAKSKVAWFRVPEFTSIDPCLALLFGRIGGG